MVEGYLYVGPDAPPHLERAEAGRRVELPRLEPPWLVVDHTLERVLVTRWPGRLFRVATVPPRTDAERAAAARAAQNLRADAGYTRALAVDVRAELPVATLFGPDGAAVCRVLDAVAALDEPTARGLAAARHPGAEAAYGAVWERWLADQPEGGPYRGQNHSRVLAVHGAGPVGSPVGEALTVLSTIVSRRAQQLWGERAHVPDADGDPVLVEPWATAVAALLDAAMAAGGRRLVPPEAVGVLTSAWRAVFGSELVAVEVEAPDDGGGDRDDHDDDAHGSQHPSG